MAKIPYKQQPLFWVGDSREQLSAFPVALKRSFGFALRLVQNGLTPDNAVPLAGLGTGVYELKDNARGDTYRVVYLIKLRKGVYVIDAFMKKSKSGRALPREIAARLQQRIREARRQDGK
ncbi:MAG: hypothetical protein RL477_1532 [Pseudomonadota bacterium]|jgi:phage-related protein